MAAQPSRTEPLPPFLVAPEATPGQLEVYARFPHGLLLVDGAGVLLDLNPAAERMVGAVDAAARCCDLLGCRRPGTPLAAGCITELALEHPGLLPDVRLDLVASGTGPVSVWVTAAPLRLDGSLVVLELRRGMPGDRRRRAEAHWSGAAELRVQALGSTRLQTGEGALDGDWLGHRPGQLLKYLICRRGRVVGVDELLEAFWPAQGRSAMTTLRQTVHVLRDRLEPGRVKHARSAFVVARGGGYELDRGNVAIDVDEFERTARHGLQAPAVGEAAMAEPVLIRAAELYGGDFLSDEPYAEWAFAERDRLRDLAVRVLRALGTARLAAGDLEGATGHAQRAAELEPFDAELQRELIGVQLRRGRHRDAQRHYEAVSKRFAQAFGDGPGFTLADVGRDVREGGG